MTSKTFNKIKYIEEGEHPRTHRKSDSSLNSPWKPNLLLNSTRPSPSLGQSMSYTAYGKFSR